MEDNYSHFLQRVIFISTHILQAILISSCGAKKIVELGYRKVNLWIFDTFNSAQIHPWPPFVIPNTAARNIQKQRLYPLSCSILHPTRRFPTPSNPIQSNYSLGCNIRLRRHYLQPGEVRTFSCGDYGQDHHHCTMG